MSTAIAIPHGSQELHVAARAAKAAPEPRRHTLVLKLTLLVGLTVAALIAALVLAGFRFGTALLHEEIDARLNSVVSSRRDMVLAHIAQYQQQADLLGRHGELRGLLHNLKTHQHQPDTANEAFSQGWLNEMTDHRAILSASLVDWTGHVLLADKGTPVGADLSADPAFVRGQQEPYVGTPRVLGDRFVATVAAPILSYDRVRKKIGALLITVDLSPLAAALKDTTGLGRTGEVLLVVREGANARSIFPPRGQSQPVTVPLAAAPAMAAALNGQTFFGTTDGDHGEAVLAVAQPLGYEGWGLVAKIDASEAYAPIASALRYLLLYGGIFALAGLGAAYLLARGIARPVERLVRATSRVAAGEYETSLPVDSNDEFGVLTERFNEMTASIRQRGAERDAVEQERQRAEAKLLDMQKLESLGVLAGGIAHDFNNLLTGVIGNASLVQMDLEEGSPHAEPLSEVVHAAEHAADLCQQMLAYAGKGLFVLRDLDLSALVRETAQLIERSIAKGVSLQFHLVESLPLVSGDPSQLRQVVMNLVMNASEAIGQRGGKVHISTSVLHADRVLLDTAFSAQQLPEGDYVQLEVSDNGEGMSTETIARIFDPFFTTKFTGRGMGLAAVLGIVRGHNGALKVYSEPGQGTAFKILFPCVGIPVTAAGPLKIAADAWRGSGVVLVADDEETVRKIAVRMLESFGFTVLTASDGREAIERYQAVGEVRAVLLDLTMPHLDGEVTFRELQKLNPRVRVVLMSGYNEQEAVPRFINQGLAGFLQKPFDIESLRQRMKEILA